MLICAQLPEGKFLVTKFEFGGGFGMSLEGDCYEVEVTPNLESLVTFVIRFIHKCTTSSCLIWR